MSIPTIIRHEELEEGFICIVAQVSDRDVRVQQYTTGVDGRTSLEQEWVFSSETAAIANFNNTMGIE